MIHCVDKEICKECKGACCKRTGCIYLPEDFHSMEYEYLLELIKKGNISINLDIFKIHGTLDLYNKFKISDVTPFNQDLWSFYLYLRARNINSDIIDFLGKEGTCSMLTENGCSYKDSERPSLGLSLIPQKNGDCKQIAKQYTYQIMFDWIKHQDVLNKIVFKLSNKSPLDLFKEACENDAFYRFFCNNFSHYINPVDGIRAECNYCNINIDEKVNVKKLIFK